MGLIKRLVEGVLETKVGKEVLDRRVKEAIPPTGDSIDPDPQLWRPLTGARSKDRALNPIEQRRMQEIAFWLWDATPMGHRIVEMTKDFTIGEGIRYEAVDANVQKILDEFWFDSDNAWDVKQHQRARELSLFGEQFYPVFVNESNGKVKMGYFDPSIVAEVVRDKINPERWLLVKVLSSSIDSENKSEYKIVDIDRDPYSSTYGRLVGEIFYFPINNVSMSSRGRSDLLSVADWIDMHEKYLFNVAEKAYIQSCYIWDWQFEGMNQDNIDEWVKTHQIDLAKPGSNFYHNEKVKLEAKNPRLESQDHADEARLIKNHILTGVAIPEHWVGEGEKTTRATALEMGTPSFKHFKTRQIYFKFMIQHIFDFVIDQAIIHKRLDDKVDRTVYIILPPITDKDLVEISSAMVNLTASLTSAVSESWISKDDAERIYKGLLAKLGYDFPNAQPPLEEAKKTLEANQRELARKLEESKK